MTARKKSDVTDAELAVLQALWERGPSTIRELTDLLYPGGATAHYATVQKLLERLEAKRCVRRRRGPGPHVFSAAVEREELIGLRLRELADQLCEGSLSPLLTELVRGRALSAEERRTLGDLVEQLDARNQSRRQGKGGPE
jgi:predicted transcriptional regulator